MTEEWFVGSIQLVRHGQASFGQPDYDRLSDLGRQQADVLGASWATNSPSVSYVSGGLRRQEDTATISRWASGGTSRGIGIDERWNEFAGLGSNGPSLATSTDARTFQAELNVALERWMAGNSDADETFDEFSDRVMSGLEAAMFNTPRGGSTRIFTSAGPIALVCSRLLIGDASLFRRFNDVLFNASVTTIIFGSNAPRLLKFNECSHLPDQLSSFR